MLPHRQAVVASEDDQGVVGDALRVECRHDAPELVVQVGNHRVVLGDVAADFLRRAWKPSQHFVADAQRAVVERMSAQEVRRQLHVVSRIHVQKPLRHRARVVGREQRHVGEERFVGLRIEAADVVDHGIRKHLARMSSSMDVVAVPPSDFVVAEGQRIGNVRQASVVLSGLVVVVGRHVPMVGHAAEVDLVAIVEAAVEAGAPVVPFASAPGGVAVAAQRFAEHGVFVGNGAAGIVQVEQRAPGVQHGAARHADGAVGAAGNVRVGERGAARDQAVEIGRADVAPESAQRVEALVVREEQQDVGRLALAHVFPSKFD